MASDPAHQAMKALNPAANGMARAKRVPAAEAASRSRRYLPGGRPKSRLNALENDASLS
jgi:hypothetical protein